MYNWWVFVHLVGVFGFLAFHGVSISVLFRLRKERDPQRVNDLLQLSASSIQAFYISLVVLVAAGIVAGFLGRWWSFGWIWGAIVVLVLTSLAMYAMASPFYRRVRLVARAMADGSKAVTKEQFDSILSSRRPLTVAAIGFAGLLVILYLMVMKPTLGFSPAPPILPSPSPGGASVEIVAQALSFDSNTVMAPASKDFVIVFRNDGPGIQHNVAIYTNSSASTALFVGSVVTGPSTIDYDVPALSPGTYFFRCDIHPSQMTGTFIVS